MTKKMSDAYRDKEDRSALNRLGNIEYQSVLKVLIAIAVITGTSITLVGIGSQPALAASLTAGDVSITTEDGEITALNINPSLTVTWSGLEKSFDIMSAKIYISNSSSNRKIEGESIYRSICDTGGPNPPDCGEMSGNYTFEYGNENINLFNASSYFGSTVDNPPIKASDFSAAEGATKTTTVYVLVAIDVFDSDGTGFNSVEKELSFDVTVTNEAANMSAKGSLNTTVEG